MHSSLLLASLVPCAPAAGVLAVDVPDVVLLETEAFDDLGGWVLDQQFMDLMGSPFLLAHGMGVPVADALAGLKLVSSPAWWHNCWPTHHAQNKDTGKL